MFRVVVFALLAIAINLGDAVAGSGGSFDDDGSEAATPPPPKVEVEPSISKVPEVKPSTGTSQASRNTSLRCSWGGYGGEVVERVFIDRRAQKIWKSDVFGIRTYELYRTPDERTDWGELIERRSSRHKGLYCDQWKQHFSIDRYSLQFEMVAGPVCTDPDTGERLWIVGEDGPLRGGCDISNADYSGLSRPRM